MTLTARSDDLRHLTALSGPGDGRLWCSSTTDTKGLVTHTPINAEIAEYQGRKA